MTGLLSADFRKLFKSKSLYVCMFIAAALGVCMSLLYNYFWQERGQNIALWYAMMNQYGMKTDMLDEALSQIPSQNLLSYLNVFLSDGAIWLIGAPCICAYSTAEYNAGTYKNTVARGCSRVKLFVSKLTAAVTELLIISFVYLAAGTITALPHIELATTLQAGEIAFMAVIYFILIIASACVFLMLTSVFRRSGFAVAAAIAAPMLIASLIQIASLASPELSKLSGYILMNTFVTVQKSVTAGTGLTEMITGIAYIAVSGFVGGIIFVKREVR